MAEFCWHFQTILTQSTHKVSKPMHCMSLLLWLYGWKLIMVINCLSCWYIYQLRTWGRDFSQTTQHKNIFLCGLIVWRMRLYITYLKDTNKSVFKAVPCATEITCTNHCYMICLIFEQRVTKRVLQSYTSKLLCSSHLMIDICGIITIALLYLCHCEVRPNPYTPYNPI